MNKRQRQQADFNMVHRGTGASNAIARISSTVHAMAARANGALGKGEPGPDLALKRHDRAVTDNGKSGVEALDGSLSIRTPDESGIAGEPGSTLEQLGAPRRDVPDAEPSSPLVNQDEGEEKEPPPCFLPFDQYVRWAVETDREHRQAMQEACAWESPLFHFMRLVKAHGQMDAMKGKRACLEVEAVILGWYSKATRKLADVWMDYLEVERVEAVAEFCGAWDKIKVVPGRDPFMTAMNRAKSKPLGLSAELMEDRPDAYPGFISLAGWLQVLMSPGTILLPVERLAELQGVSPITISRYRTWGKEDRFLKEVVPAVFRSKGKKGRATEFMFDVSRWRLLMEAARPGTAEAFQAAQGIK